MSKAWEEEWEASDRCVIINNGKAFATPTFPSQEHAKLAAQAPAMARLLLEYEWHQGSADSEMSERRYGLCPECWQSRGEGHSTKCELAQVLRAAGVLDDAPKPTR